MASKSHSLRSSLPALGLAELLARQLNNGFPDGEIVAAGELMAAVSSAMRRLEFCFGHIANKYFFDGESSVFDHLHSDQYAMWLYFVSNELFRQSAPSQLCKKVFCLNKAMHACDIFYEVELPSIFLLVHPLGTVLGRGHYRDYLMVYQRCGVGSNHDIYPTLGEHVTMRPGSAVLGNSQVGDNCAIATESLLLDRKLPANSVYIGNPRDHLIRSKPNKEPVWRS